MRQFQITLFILATASLIASAFELGPNSGDYLLSAGIAALLVDVVCIQLWPSAKRNQTGPVLFRGRPALFWRIDAYCRS